MSSPSSFSLSPKTRRNAKNAVIAALAILSTVAEAAPIPGAKVPATVLIELINGLEVSGVDSVWSKLLLMLLDSRK